MTEQADLQKYPKIYSGKYAEIYDLSSELPHTIFAFWKGFFQISDRNFLKEMSETPKLIKNKNVKICISDHSYLKVVSSEVLNWLHNNWYKNSSAYGLLLELSIDTQSAKKKHRNYF
ncbi:MAG: hypothetical protein CSA05_01060 [Bacteroidia bacterium]|nr:MAG: hypothetical protein CSA05_01060 [Bacteroidia bacterium]